MDNFWNISQAHFDLNDDSQSTGGFQSSDSVPLGAFLNNSLFPQNNSSVPYPSNAQYNESVPIIELDGQFAPPTPFPNPTQPLTSETQYATPPSTNCRQPTATTKAKAKAKGKKKAVGTEGSEGGSHRSSNYTIDEDLCLVSAWLNVSRDPVVGTNQSYEAYWDCITSYYVEHKPSYLDRTKKLLQHRWDSINSAVSKFVGFKAQQDCLNQGGKTEKDRIEKSKALFESEKGSPKWVFHHCWEVLRHSKKWEDHRLNKEEQAETLEGLNLNNVAGGSAEPSDSKRPMGRDAAKKRKSGAPSDSESQCLEVLQQIAAAGERNNESMAAAREEQSANQKVKLQILQSQTNSQSAHAAAVVAKEKRKEFEHDRAIMDADLNAMSGHRKDFYEAMQQRILTKYGINNNNGPSD